MLCLLHVDVAAANVHEAYVRVHCVLESNTFGVLLDQLRQ